MTNVDDSTGWAESHQQAEDSLLPPQLPFMNVMSKITKRKLGSNESVLGSNEEEE